MIDLKRESDFPKALLEFIIKWGAPNKLISDFAKSVMSKNVKEILCQYRIDEWHSSETYYQHQKPRRAPDSGCEAHGQPGHGSLWSLG